MKRQKTKKRFPSRNKAYECQMTRYDNYIEYLKDRKDERSKDYVRNNQR